MSWQGQGPAYLSPYPTYCISFTFCCLHPLRSENLDYSMVFAFQDSADLMSVSPALGTACSVWLEPQFPSSFRLLRFHHLPLSPPSI